MPVLVYVNSNFAIFYLVSQRKTLISVKCGRGFRERERKKSSSGFLAWANTRKEGFVLCEVPHLF